MLSLLYILDVLIHYVLDEKLTNHVVECENYERIIYFLFIVVFFVVSSNLIYYKYFNFS